MESLFVRHRNIIILVALLFAQILGLATQVKRSDPEQPERETPLIRLWVVSAITPVEKAVAATGRGLRNSWNNYIDLRNVRQQNAELRAEVERLRVEQVRLEEQASQAQRLQALFEFKQRFIGQTVGAQVIGSSGSEQSRLIYIDKGSNSGIAEDMAVITPDGIVGKTVRVLPGSSQVLLLTDQSWGVGAILEKTRLIGIAKGTPAGDVKLANILADEQVQVGERVLTSGGDRIFPKGLPIGTVAEVMPRQDLFLNLRLTPAANLNRLEEVLVITQVAESAPASAESEGARTRAADILAERLPSVKKPEPEAKPAEKPAVRARPPTNQPQQQKPPAQPAETPPAPAAAEDNPR